MYIFGPNLDDTKQKKVDNGRPKVCHLYSPVDVHFTSIVWFMVRKWTKKMSIHIQIWSKTGHTMDVQKCAICIVQWTSIKRRCPEIVFLWTSKHPKNN